MTLHELYSSSTWQRNPHKIMQCTIYAIISQGKVRDGVAIAYGGSFAFYALSELRTQRRTLCDLTSARDLFESLNLQPALLFYHINAIGLIPLQKSTSSSQSSWRSISRWILTNLRRFREISNKSLANLAGQMKDSTRAQCLNTSF